jgi:hypothetical protein
MKLKSDLEMRIEHLRGIIRDVGDQGSAGIITDYDVWEAEQVLKAIERGETPKRTDREQVDSHLGIHRSH